MKAFPVTKFNSHRAGHDGMDLRDYFAAAALQGLLAHTPYNAVVDAQKYVMQSYEWADAMMEARQK